VIRLGYDPFCRHSSHSSRLLARVRSSEASVGAEQLLTQLAAFILVTGNLCQLPVFVHRVDAKAPAFRDRTPEAKSKVLQLGVKVDSGIIGLPMVNVLESTLEGT
jgi:hypothetical protein